MVRSLTRRGLRGAKRVISDCHERIKAAVSKLFSTRSQCCRVHFMRNLFAHSGKTGRRVVSVFVATAFAQETPETAKTQWRQAADQFRSKLAKLAGADGRDQPDVLASMIFPKQHRTKLHSTNPLERLNGEIKRCSDSKLSSAIRLPTGKGQIEKNVQDALQSPVTMDSPSTNLPCITIGVGRKPA
jgi:putative transposase